MKANELRIGNYVKDPYSKTIRLVDVDVADAPMLTPIPLTEEWLVRFGFDGLNHNNQYLFELIHNNILGYRFSIEGQYGYPEIKYVHQLQNLYFALTGEELTLKNDNK